MWKFDDKKGRIQEKDSFTIEMPPYMQDLSDAGKGVSDGWGFTNSFNTEMYTGGIEVGMPPNEAGMSRNDTDFLHVYNWRKLAKLAENKKNVKVDNCHRIIPMSVAVANNALFLIPEPKSPHGVDVSPDGEYITVCGKLDTHASVFQWSKIKKLIESKKYIGKDPYGIPILDMKSSLHGQVELGLGPLHNQYSPVDGEIYTSLYVDSQVVKWNYKTLKILDKENVHYNVGHLCGMEGKSADPQGKYIISLNKLAIDRFDNVGPLHPQNHQLIDIKGKTMDLLVDMPLPLGEPHQAVAIRAGKLHPHVRYPMGTNVTTGKQHIGKTLAGQEKSKEVVNDLVKTILDDEFTIRSLMQIATHDYYTHTHSLNVSIYAISFGKALGFSKDDLNKAEELFNQAMQLEEKEKYDEAWEVWEQLWSMDIYDFNYDDFDYEDYDYEDMDDNKQ